MNGVTQCDEDYGSEFVEVDPSRRYGRYSEILGKGATKTVYRGFDEYEGIEVAWNQVKLQDFLRNPEDLERLYCEIHLLKTLKHANIMKFFASWVDAENRNLNFVTEMFTSGTLRQYREKHKRVNIRAVKHWCRQILRGLAYLHSLSPPVIHRDLKCDNIFINGNQGEVKIGDLGLAAIMRKSHAERCVGTPEFMAPEVYEEEYNELVDIYAFGMCVLEMVTFEYPYSECTHAAEIYKKVVSGKKPEALYKVKDQEVKGFIEKCLATVSLRLSARELLDDPFLRIDDFGYDFSRQPYYGFDHNERALINGYGYNHGYESDNDYGTSEINLFTCQDGEAYRDDDDIAIQGQRREDDGIFLRLRIVDKEGRIRNIYFPFDLENDTVLSVAGEMVDVLDITDQDVMRIANMIDGEISTLVPEWKKGSEVEEIPYFSDKSSLCHDSGSNGSPLVDYITPEDPSTKNLQVLQCSKHDGPTIHGRFEEITYQVEQCPTEEIPELSYFESNGIRYTDIWAQRDGPEFTSKSNMSECGEEERTIRKKNQNVVRFRISRNHNPISALFEGNGNEIRQELRWLRAKYQMQLREARDKQLRPDCLERKEDNESHQQLLNEENRTQPLKNSSSFKDFRSHFLEEDEATKEPHSPKPIFTVKSFYTGDLLPQQPLHRATSLPVDAIYF